MSNELLASKVVILEEEPTQRGIAALPTSVAGVVGVAQKGPLGVATLVTTWDEYQRRFGGFVPGADLPLGVLGFFQNGGRQLWVVRTCHYDDVADPATAAAVTATAALLSAATPTAAEVTGATLPLALTAGDAIKLVQGTQPAATIAFTGVAAHLDSTKVAPFALAVGQTLQVAVDGGAPQPFTVGATGFVDVTKATAAEVVTALGPSLTGVTVTADGQNHVVLTSATRGTASRLELLGGTAAAAFGFPTAAAGAGNVARLAAVTLAEVAAAAQLAAPGVRVDAAPGGALRLRTSTTGPTASLQCQAGTAAAFGLNTTLHVGATLPATRAVAFEALSPGAWAKRVSLEVRAGTQPATFTLLVREGALLRESFPDVSLVPSSARYVERLVNDAARGSTYVRATDLRVVGASIPAQVVPLDGGDDGLANLDDTDFLGAASSGTGVHALDNVPDVSLLFVPGRANAAFHTELLTYAADPRRGTVFVVLDPPPQLDAMGILAYQQSAGLEGLSEFGALYWPRLRIANPSPAVYGVEATVGVPPSGAIVGMIARTDGARPGGIYDPPAGVEVGILRGVAGLESTDVLDERKRDLLYPHRLNPLNRTSTGSWYVDGVYTLKGDGNFPTIAERRGVSYIERSLRNGLEFARHRNNDDALASEVFRTIKGFLVGQMALGAFASRDPKTAFFLDVSRDPAERARGELHVKVGLATQKPAEFIVIHLSQATLPRA
jgi:hypothetical protein